MPQQHDNEKRGILSRNDRKQADKHPDFRGSCQIGGVEYWIDGWINTRRDGTGRFFSLRFNEKAARETSGNLPPEQQRQMHEDADIPF